MDPAIGRFTTMDPMAEKKPWLTPYHYCSNNPVNRIDLDGKDDFKYSNLGQIIRVSNTKNNGSKVDRLYAKDGSYITVTDKEFLPGLITPSVHGTRKFTQKTIYLDDAIKVFKHAAENTDKEWGLDIYKKGDEKYAVIATKMDPQAVQMTNEDNKDSEHLVDLHSHPRKDGTRGGSPNDMNNVKYNEKKAHKIAVFHPYDGKLYEYTEKKSQSAVIDAQIYEQILDYITK